MINTTDDIILLQKDACQHAAEALDELTQHAFKQVPNLGGTSLNCIGNTQVRHRLALPIFLERRRGRAVTEEELGQLYRFCIASDAELPQAHSNYSALTGTTGQLDEDVLGLRIPVRAMFVMLWINGKVIMPHTFTVSGVWPKYPKLKKRSETFIYNIAKDTKNNPKQVIRASRTFQYHVDWHSSTSVSFEELWEAAPLVIDKIREIRSSPSSKSLNFSYLNWVKCLSNAYPKIISPEEAIILKGYHKHLGLTKNDGSSAEHKKSYSEFVSFWGATSGTPSEEDLQRRVKIRYEKGIDKRKEKRQKKSEEKARAAEEKLLQASSILSPEEYANLPWHKPKPRTDYAWVEGYYTSGSIVDIELKLARWVRIAELHLNFFEGRVSLHYLREQVSYVHILIDYLGDYIPNWISKNPDTTVCFPEYIEDFHRTLFWNRTKVDTAFEDLAEDSNVSTPLTLMQFYDLRRAKFTKTAFIKCIYRFFEIGALNAKTIMPDGEPLIGPFFRNPVNPELDPQGSGTPDGSNKVPLPIDSMILIESYMSALDKIGVELQERCLTGYYNTDVIKKLRSTEWINLEAFGLHHTIKIWDPADHSKTIEIPLTRIMNVYTWRKEKYRSAKGTVYAPWLSPLRMLSIALFTGLRVQNCQWLDIRSFAKHYDETLKGSLSSCLLFVNTCKNGTSRAVSIPYKIMETLMKERDFQLNEYAVPYSGVYYQNDPQDAPQYGLIHPLFRSPYHNIGLPFSDAAYTRKWTLILRGFQEVFNSFVPEGRHHDFVLRDNSEKWMAVHTPHALRATWITHRRIYASLDYAIIGAQAGHANKYTTAHYVVPTMIEHTTVIDAANALVSAHAYSALMGRTPTPSSQHSAMVKGFASNREATIREQHLISVIPQIMDAEETGADIIFKTKSDRMKFMDCCICSLAGNCPKKLLDFSRKARTCGICPYAVFGIDHLPGMNARVRELANVAEKIKRQIQRTYQHQADSSEIEVLNEELSLCMMELAGYLQAVKILEKNMADEELAGGYIGRHRDLSGAIKHEVDMESPKQRILSMMLDSAQFPGFASEHYPYILEEMARSPELLNLVNMDSDDKDIYIGQILSIMGGAGISFGEISNRALSTSGVLALLD